MKSTLAIASVLLFSLAGISHAKTLKLPTDKPAVQVAVPDSYKPEEIDNGYTCESKDEAVTIYFETTAMKGMEALIGENVDYLVMQGVKIDADSKKTKDFEANGMKVGSVTWDGKQKGYGDETVTMYFIKLDDDTMFIITYWVTKKGEREHQDEISKIFDSVKPL